MAGLALLTNTILLLPLLGGLYVFETLSVIAQVISFRCFHRRVLRMAPIHHHFEVGGWPEFTVIVRFWLLAGLLVALGLGFFYADFIRIPGCSTDAGARGGPGDNRRRGGGVHARRPATTSPCSKTGRRARHRRRGYRARVAQALAQGARLVESPTPARPPSTGAPPTWWCRARACGPSHPALSPPTRRACDPLRDRLAAPGCGPVPTRHG